MNHARSLFAIGAAISISVAAAVHAQDTYFGPDGGLTASGNQIVDQNGNNVRLTGVNWSGFETPIGVVSGLYQSPSATASPDFRDYLLKIKDLGFNCVRLPWSYANMICTQPAAADEGSQREPAAADKGSRRRLTKASAARRCSLSPARTSARSSSAIPAAPSACPTRRSP